MAEQLTEADARESLRAHVAAKGEAIRARYGPAIGWKELQLLLEDRVYVRYPCEIIFDADNLMPGECAYPAARSDCPDDGFVLFVHPFFRRHLNLVPYPVLYQLVVVNYGDFASSADAETFGAAVLGLTRSEYYRMLCELTDTVADMNDRCTAISPVTVKASRESARE